MLLKRVTEKLENRVFNKILFIYSITIVLTLFLLLLVLSRYYTQVKVKEELDKNSRTLDRIESHFYRKQEYLQSAVRELYMKNDLLNDISFALRHNYSDYLSFKLNKYYNSNSFVPNNLDTFLQTVFSEDNDINAVSLKSATTNLEYLYVFNNYRWNRSIADQKEAVENSFFSVKSQEDRERETKNSFYLKQNINDPAFLKNLGHLTVYYSFDGVDELLDTRKYKSLGTIQIFNKEGDALYRSEKGTLPEPIKKPRYGSYSKKVRWDGDTYYINALADDESGYMYVGFIPEKEIAKITIVHWTMVLFTILFAIAAIIIAYLAMRDYSKRIYLIDKTMKQVKKGDLTVRVQTDVKKDELSAISASLNNMLDELNEYIEQVYLLNIQQREAEMKALQSQIQPHFLYNTLEAIRMKAVIDGSKTTGIMIFNLAQLLRYSLTNKEIVTIEDEIEHVKKYLELIQIRYSSQLNVSFEISEKYLSNEILKFTLQPLIENYVKYGFKKDEKDNQIIIAAKEIQGILHIHVQDNGYGISNNRLEEIRLRLNETNIKSDSIGLSNVNERIKLKYGKMFGIDIQSSVNTGTTVDVSIPIS